MPKSKTVRAKEAIVINVGGSPRQYGKVTVVDRRTNERVQIDYTDGNYENHRDFVPEDPGVPYAFKAYEKVPADHPAVKANPGAFVADDSDE